MAEKLPTPHTESRLLHALRAAIMGPLAVLGAHSASGEQRAPTPAEQAERLSELDKDFVDSWQQLRAIYDRYKEIMVCLPHGATNPELTPAEAGLLSELSALITDFEQISDAIIGSYDVEGKKVEGPPVTSADKEWVEETLEGLQDLESRLGDDGKEKLIDKLRRLSKCDVS